MGITREGKGPIKLVALAPADDGVTLEDQPRLWWWQSEATKAEDLVFMVTKLVPDGKELKREPVFQKVLGPKKAGVNWIDLSDPLINDKKLRLEEAAEYNWSVAYVEGEKEDSVEVPMRRVANAELANQWKAEPLAVPTLNALSSSGNWYELFDAVACSAFLDPGNEACVKLRQRLLAEVGLGSALTP